MIYLRCFGAGASPPRDPSLSDSWATYYAEDSRPTVPADGLTVADCRVNGTLRNFARYLVETGADTRLPLVADYAGAQVHTSFQSIGHRQPARPEEEGIIGVAVLAQDITERRQAEVALQRLNRELRAISVCNEVLVRAEDEDTLLHEICRIVCEEAGYRMAWVGYAEHDEAKTVRSAAWAGHEDGYLAGARITWADVDSGRGPTGRAIRTGAAAWIDDFAADPAGAPWRDAALARGYRSSISLPLKDEAGSPFGMLCIYSAERAAFSPDEIRLLEELASDLAFGIGVIRAREAHARLEAQLRQAQKMEVVGQLAGGIAHDFNNVLTAIHGYGELLRAELPPNDAASRGDLEEVLAAAGRAELLTRQLLAFARRQVLVPVVLRPAEIVSSIAPMLRRVLGEQVELVTSCAPDTGRVRVDPGQLEQVIVNLAVNARDAMPGGGRLAIGTSAVELDGEYAATHPDAPPDSYLSLTVSDTGVGMDAETQSHLFEPFFTTKPEGKGTGLGLATVYGIVRQSGGSISVYSEVGHGTTVRILLPRLPEEGESATASNTEAPRPVPCGTETILLVEDDPAVRAYGRWVLSRLGYTVLEATNGIDALAFAADTSRIDLLATDIVMPGMQGIELARRLTAARPDLRVLYMSGFADNQPGQTDLLADASFLAKPFSSEALGRAVRAVLDAAVPESS